ncbi:16S rRNA (guanine966-N2)-methyltransferase [Cereibacter changlensis]|uniref:16S rRNA (Guanine966-N2)-methyltransferase n=1 Tax=Cereibacter changlensis TaxID=402884 RepID=A0A2W7RJV9_9RHOB|nr:16S rRNA (guanine(966)-N(2))-methyltransferase RsmD [Cereibacter changlensis]PZX58730.1 16S rRNA (guanine966-N2)-methyltransferase [Cereibacter changlensis]
MRIIGGARRGTHLAPVGEGDAKAHLRPTSDRVREAIFNLLINGGYGAPLQDAHVLDLFAGTGALGLEALSRGAAHASFVETGAAALALLRRNIEILRMGPATAILRRDATAPGPNPGAPFDVVFLDPPYGKGLGEAALAAAGQTGWLAPEALVVWEESTPPAPPPGFTQQDQRRYGDTLVTILRAP